METTTSHDSSPLEILFAPDFHIVPSLDNIVSGKDQEIWDAGVHTAQALRLAGPQKNNTLLESLAQIFPIKPDAVYYVVFHLLTTCYDLEESPKPQLPDKTRLFAVKTICDTLTETKDPTKLTMLGIIFSRFFFTGDITGSGDTFLGPQDFVKISTALEERVSKSGEGFAGPKGLPEVNSLHTMHEKLKTFVLHD